MWRASRLLGIVGITSSAPHPNPPLAVQQLSAAAADIAAVFIDDIIEIANALLFHFLLKHLEVLVGFFQDGRGFRLGIRRADIMQMYWFDHSSALLQHAEKN